jgi:hypothetical protein
MFKTIRQVSARTHTNKKMHSKHIGICLCGCNGGWGLGSENKKKNKIFKWGPW